MSVKVGIMKLLKYTTAVICVLSLILLVVPAMAAPAGTRAKGERGKVGPVTYKPGEVIVIWKDGAPAAEKASARSSANVERVLATGRGSVGRNRQLLKLAPGVSTEAAANALNRNGAVKAAGLNRLRKLSYTPPSTDFTKQWGLNNTGQTIGGQPGIPGADIDATNAWDIERGNSNATTVAVIDSGIDLNHPNLSGRLWTNSADPVNGIDDDGNGYIDDYHGYNWAGISSYAYTDAWGFGTDSSSQYVAQQFTAQGINAQCRVEGLEMFFYGKTGDPAQTITYAIRSSLTGVDIVKTNPIPPSRIAASGESFVYEPFTSVANLTPGTNYFFVVYTSATDTSNYYAIVDHVYDNDSPSFDSYVEGSEWRKNGEGWIKYPQDDFYFKASGYYYNRDNNGHGTHCSGIVGAADSGSGSVGVAPGNATRLMALKAGDSSGSLWSNDWMDAIDYASSMGADIASMSFGGTGSDPVEQTVITNAYNNGVALFASSGNSGDSTIQYPVAYNGVIGVGATDNRDAHAYFSTYNSSVDVSGPGVKYYSTMPTYPVTLNEFGYARDYDYLSGTSMACPCAAGTGALVRSKYPAYTPAQTQSRLQSTADNPSGPGRNDYFGWGRVNAWRAVGGTNPAPFTDKVVPESGPPGTQVTITGSGFGSTRDSGIKATATSYVSFNGVQATEYQKWSDTEIQCTVPDGASSGPVTVVTSAGSSGKEKTFTVSSPTWYLAEGSTDWGFTTYITIENPNTSEVSCHVTYMTGSGAKQIPDVTLPPESQLTFNPQSDLGNTDFSTKVECTDPKKNIAVDRTMTWTGPGAKSPEAHSSVGVSLPAKTWYLPEGSCQWGFETWLLMQNPNDTEATCQVTYMTEGKGYKAVEHKVPANSRKTYNMADDTGFPADASVKVESDIPVIPERAMYRNNRREGHDSIGTTTPAPDYYLAEGTTDWGFTTYVLVQNPNSSPTDVSITYMTGSGPVEMPAVRMDPNSRKTIRVNDIPEMKSRDLSTRVHGSAPIIAERAMYWGGDKPQGEACHDSIGMSQPHATFYLPDGQTSDGRETWTLVQNPNGEEVEVEVSYLTPSGQGNKVRADKVPANSRRTYSMADSIPAGRAAIMVTSKTPGKKIMVERAMYWNNRGAGTDTVGGYGD